MAGKPIVIVGAGETADIAHEYFTVESDREVVPPAGWDVVRVKHYGTTVVTVLMSPEPA